MPRLFLLAPPIPVALALAATGCHRSEEPVSTSSSSTAASTASPSDAARKSPSTPSSASGQTSPKGPAEPDWALDPNDAATDYVKRYVHATGRYGDKSACVTVGPSTFVSGHSVVETHNDASGTCGAPNELRDRFFVTVATDRMSLDSSLHQPALKSWPDGSPPDGPPRAVLDLPDLRAWKTDLHEALKNLLLAPIRVQLYGRGSYPIVTLAGWHVPVMRTSSSAELEKAAATLCAANEGQPLALFGGLDRSVVLRIRCPNSATFEPL